VLRTLTPAAKTQGLPQTAPQTSARQAQLPQDAGTSILLPIAAIEPNPWDPRRNPLPFSARPSPEELSLAASIARHGVLENLLVRPAPAGRFQIIFGERRLRCAIAAAYTEVPAVVRPLDDHEARVLTLTESLRSGQRPIRGGPPRRGSRTRAPPISTASRPGR
jgi:ParB family chromosome partitioning protein